MGAQFLILMGVEAQRAIAMSLAVVAATSLLGALLHYRQGTLRIKTVLQFGIAGITGAYLGAGLAYLLRPQLLMLIFALLLWDCWAICAITASMPASRCSLPYWPWPALSPARY